MIHKKPPYIKNNKADAPTIPKIQRARFEIKCNASQRLQSPEEMHGGIKAAEAEIGMNNRNRANMGNKGDENFIFNKFGL